MKMPTQRRREISVQGIVQGVGFRPFIYSLAQSPRLLGEVEVIGEEREEPARVVLIHTQLGSAHMVAMLVKDPLPGIC